MAKPFLGVSKTKEKQQKMKRWNKTQKGNRKENKKLSFQKMVSITRY